MWAREIGRMVGLELPSDGTYVSPEDMPEVKAFNETLHHPLILKLYLRQERGGMLMGTYEKACSWSEQTTPWSFGHELLEPDIDRIASSLCFEHFPAFRIRYS